MIKTGKRILKHFETWNYSNAKKECNDMAKQLRAEGHNVKTGCNHLEQFCGGKVYWLLTF